VAAGPVMLSSAMRAADVLAKEGIDLVVIDLPWLNVVDRAWLDSLVGRGIGIVAIDNHMRVGGQGQMLLASVAQSARPVPCLHLAVDGVPACGTNDEVLEAHGLDAGGIAGAIRTWLGDARSA
jgi:transketolase